MVERFDRNAQWQDVGNRQILFINPSYQRSLMQRQERQKREAEITDYIANLIKSGLNNNYPDNVKDFLDFLQAPEDFEVAKKVLLSQRKNASNVKFCIDYALNEINKKENQGKEQSQGKLKITNFSIPIGMSDISVSPDGTVVIKPKTAEFKLPKWLADKASFLIDKITNVFTHNKENNVSDSLLQESESDLMETD